MTDRLNPEAFLAAKDAAQEAFWANKDWHDITTAMLSAYDKSLADAQPRTITTVEELAAMPVGAVILDGSHYAAQSLQRSSVTGHEWYHSGAMVELASSEVELPARVLWAPTEGGRDAT